MRASVWGEQARADGDLEDDASVTAAIAMARAKRLATGFKSNSDSFVPQPAPESPGVNVDFDQMWSSLSFLQQPQIIWRVNTNSWHYF